MGIRNIRSQQMERELPIDKLVMIRGDGTGSERMPPPGTLLHVEYNSIVALPDPFRIQSPIFPLWRPFGF